MPRFWDWIRDTTGLSLQYHDVVINTVGGFIRATDTFPTTGRVDPSSDVTRTSAVGGHNEPPKMTPNKAMDSWSVSAPLPAGATVISQASAYGLDVALYGVFPATYDRIVDSLHYTAAQCMACIDGRAIKCADATSSVTLSMRGSSTEAKLSVTAKRRDILLLAATGLKAYLWLTNGDNYLVYNNHKCKRSRGRKIGLRC